jgi:hypothetical protein
VSLSFSKSIWSAPGILEPLVWSSATSAPAGSPLPPCFALTMSLIAKPARAEAPVSGRAGARMEKMPIATTAAAAASPAIQPHPGLRGVCEPLTRAPARIASRRPAGGAICPSLAATAASWARDCANHAPSTGSSPAMRSASPKAGSPVSLPLGRKAERMNLASSVSS